MDNYRLYFIMIYILIIEGEKFMDNYGFVKCAAATPKLKVANPDYNIKEIIKIIDDCKENVQVLVFPELCITGYTCGDLFNQKHLIDSSLKALKKLMQETKNVDSLIFIGMPLYIKGSLYNLLGIF